VSWDDEGWERPVKGRSARDVKIDGAKQLVLDFLSKNNEGVFYIKQLQVLLEETYYHWIVGRAVGELIGERAIGISRWR